MEEILASIRRIISEDEQGGDKAPEPAAGAAPAPAAKAEAPAAPPPPADDVLELTEVVNADGSVSSLKDGPAEPEAEPEPLPEPEPEPFPEPSFEPEPEPEAPVFSRPPESPPPPPRSQPSGVEGFDLLSERAAASSAAAFSGLLGSVGGGRGMPLGDSAKTLEELVKELLRPMLKDWLDRNLPGMVERLVAREIAKIAGQAERD